MPTSPSGSPRLRSESKTFSPESVRPPSPVTLLSSLSDKVYETAVDEFNAVAEALGHLRGDEDHAAVEARILERIEQVDLVQDAVQSALDREIRRSAPGLVEGIKQVQELDLDITRTSLQVTSARRRLAAARLNLHDAELRVVQLARARERSQQLQGVVHELLEAAAKLARVERATRVEDAIAAAKDLLVWLEAHMDRRLRVLVRLEETIKSRLPGLAILLDKELCLLLENGFDADEYVSLVHAHALLGLDALPERIGAACEALLREAFSKGEDPVQTAMELFVTLEHMQDFHSAAADPAWAALRWRMWRLVEQLTSALLKSPEARALLLEQFANLIARCDELVEFGRSFLGDEASLSLAGAIRARSRAYALQVQGEGFEALRGFLLRENWAKFSAESAANAAAVLARCGLSAPGSVDGLAITVTTASGLPAQVSRTMELMRRLPASAAEAFMGLVRCFYVYVLATVTGFGHDAELRYMPPVLASFCAQARESLRDWLADDAALLNGMDAEQPWVRAVVAAESLAFVEVLALATRPALEPLLPAVERNALCARLYTDLPAARPWVERALMRSAAKKHVAERFVFESVVAIAWESETELRATPHAYVEQVVEQMKAQYRVIMSEAAISRASAQRLWDEAGGLLFEALLEGFAVVRACTLEGRASMSLDLACLVNGLADGAGVGGGGGDDAGNGVGELGAATARMRGVVDDYVKAFYYDREEDVLQWARSKRGELSLFQVCAIVDVGLFGQSLPGKRRGRDVKLELEKVFSKSG